MQKTRLTRLLWLVVFSALLVGCGAMASPPTPSPTQPPPTWTPIPPTETPVPTDTPTSVPTDTATPVPTQSISLMVEALRPAGQGVGVQEAAAYDPNKPGVHPIVIIATYEDFKLWNSYLPVSWQPMNVSQAELVALFLYHEVVIETDRRVTKGGTFFVMRVRVDTEIILREALTGKTIATTFFQGGEPPEFPPGRFNGVTAYYGTKVAYETVELWLKEFVEK